MYVCMCVYIYIHICIYIEIQTVNTSSLVGYPSISATHPSFAPWAGEAFSTASGRRAPELLKGGLGEEFSRKLIGIPEFFFPSNYEDFL